MTRLVTADEFGFVKKLVKTAFSPQHSAFSPPGAVIWTVIIASQVRVLFSWSRQHKQQPELSRFLVAFSALGDQ